MILEAVNEYSPCTERSCCFTGHRFMSAEGALVQDRLSCEVENLINLCGVDTFYAGGALGFDTLAAECVLRLKGKYPFITLVLALPCKNQAEKWSADNKQRYDAILRRADVVYYVSDVYTESCMHKRNDYMLANSKYCICYLRHNGGGTYYTVNRARSMGRELIEL